MKIAWSAIVKDESAVIERCVRSLLPHIDCAIVVDTGSEDQTPEKISRLFAQARKPFELYYTPFVDFSQARNEALRRARESKLDWDYLLLADADMELRVDRPDWINGYSGLSYDMRQVGGSLSYYNRRLVSRQADGWYQGVTHEYLDVPSAGTIAGADFLDHADGHNRPDKLLRDITLLEAALQTETRPGLFERYHFYLAQSYFDKGDWIKAAEHYKIRVALGGFDEERWYAQLQYAHCRRHLDDPAGFLWEMLQAHRMRPQRAETLHALAQFFRERAENHNSLLFSDAAMQLPFPSRDLLFVNDWVYTSGLKEEFSICAYYDERRRRRGAKICNQLALAGSAQARSNLFWYLQPLAAHVLSFKPQQIEFTPPEGYVACNPSVINHAGKLLTLVRTVNYTITSEGQYRIRASDGSLAGDHPIHTRNFIGSGVNDWREIVLPENFPEPKYALVRGFEDSRLFQRGQELWTLSTVRQLTHEGWCEQVLAPLDRSEGNGNWCYADSWKQILPNSRLHQKNWMPWLYEGELRFVYRLGTLVNSMGEVIAQHDSDFDVSHISGGSQVVRVGDRTWLALVHEAGNIPNRSNRYYQHRFVVFLPDGRVERISPPFFFHDRQIEFCAGLAYFIEDDEIMISYGVRDCEAWTAAMQLDDVLSFVYDGAAL